ncbi:MAG: hypothetical protein A2857_05975 [Candidatus Levybacteria bacterium RIFCSPHIGHO2_01_FULL_36_15]|nr:MAG: hypothetical protein A2857_05975 [Candidatus Levybacteria bacterium RIFCSPHIGHO2_01_FULL_36_15]
MDLINIYKKIIIDPSMSWVLFKNGTCAMLLEPQNDIKTQAIQILRTHGPVTAGTPSGDFEVTKTPEINGWIVTGNYPGIMMYVSSEEAGNKKSDFEIGMIGRTKRELDAKELEVVYVEDKRKSI